MIAMTTMKAMQCVTQADSCDDVYTNAASAQSADVEADAPEGNSAHAQQTRRLLPASPAHAHPPAPPRDASLLTSAQLPDPAASTGGEIIYRYSWERTLGIISVHFWRISSSFSSSFHTLKHNRRSIKEWQTLRMLGICMFPDPKTFDWPSRFFYVFA